MRPKVIAIVGAQNAGKTRLIARLVRHFVRAGLRVGTVKHASGGFDVPGTDSHAHFRAGASVTVLAGGRETAVFRRGGPASVERLVREHCGGLDVVILEGFSQEAWPQIEVVRDGRRRLARRPLAVVGDGPVDAGVARFRPGEVARLAEFILGSIRRNSPRAVL